MTPVRRWTIAAMLLVACGDAETPPGPEASTPDVPDWELEEEFRIDGLAEDLVPIPDLALGPEGTIALSQPQTHSARLYDSSGHFLTTVGRRGDGPGEFQQLFLIGRVGEFFSAYDPDLQRFTLFDSEGNLERTVSAVSRVELKPSDEGRRLLGHALVMQLTEGGDVLAGIHPFGTSNDPARRTHVVRMHTDGRVQEILARLEDQPRAIEAGSKTRRFSAQLPLQNLSKFDLAPDGSRMVVADAEVEGVAAGTYMVTGIRVDGDTIFSRRYTFEPIWISDEYADSLIEAHAEDIEEGSPELARAYRRTASTPPMMPPILSVKNGEDGTIWIRLRSASPDREYLVLNEEGRPLGRVTLPRGQSVYMADRDHVWTTVRNEYDVQSVVQYRILR